MFRLSPSTDITGISTVSELEVPPAEGDGYKVSGEFVFVNDKGEPFVVHDWKSTSLWEKRLPTPEDQRIGLTRPWRITRSLVPGLAAAWWCGNDGSDDAPAVPAPEPCKSAGQAISLIATRSRDKLIARIPSEVPRRRSPG